MTVFLVSAVISELSLLCLMAYVVLKHSATLLSPLCLFFLRALFEEFVSDASDWSCFRFVVCGFFPPISKTFTLYFSCLSAQPLYLGPERPVWETTRYSHSPLALSCSFLWLGFDSFCCSVFTFTNLIFCSIESSVKAVQRIIYSKYSIFNIWKFQVVLFFLLLLK